MSELINTKLSINNFRYGLLTQVSALAILGVAGLPTNACAGEAAPTVWIDIGGQLERVDAKQTIFAPPFLNDAIPAVSDAMVDSQRPSRYSTGFEGKISVLPKGGDWVFSVSALYGQVKNARHLHYETPGIPPFQERLVQGGNTVTPTKRNFGDGQTDSSESHMVLDFQAGKDVGVGLFGSVVSAGVRYAQFTSRSGVHLHARPILGYDPPIPYTILKYHGTVRFPYYQNNYAMLNATRSTHAIGPAVSWDGSMPLVGHDDSATLSFDWGVNAAALFGRQRVKEDHRTTGYYRHIVNKQAATTSYDTSGLDDRSHSVVIPNVGGFLGLSLKFPNAKVSLGYRGDFFFNATDSGIDVREVANRNFFGPYATISIGLP